MVFLARAPGMPGGRARPGASLAPETYDIGREGRSQGGSAARVL